MNTTVQEIKNIDTELKRLRSLGRELRQRKKNLTDNLYKYMIRNNIEEYEGIKANKIAPKPKVKRKREKDKKADAINLFTEIGIPNAEEFWDVFKSTQKYTNISE